jgi:hypothetical protein
MTEQRYQYADAHHPRNFTIDPKQLFSDLERLDAIRTMLANDYSGSTNQTMFERQQFHIRNRDSIRTGLNYFVQGNGI